MLLSTVLVFYACDKAEHELENPFDVKISCQYVIKVRKDKGYKTVATAAATAKGSVLIEIDANAYVGDLA